MSRQKSVHHGGITGAAGLVWLLFWSVSLAGQPTVVGSSTRAGTLGRTFLRNYPPTEYKAHNQNWAIVQDERGLMYLGNSYGVLEYDGATWRLIRTGGNRIVRSLAIHPDGRIFTGGYGDIGYLVADSLQRFKYVSLRPQIKESYADFDVWNTLCTPAGVFFITNSYVFRWDGQTMRSWKAQTGFKASAWIGGQLYVFQPGVGLMLLDADSMRLMPGSEALADKQVVSVLPWGAADGPALLLATRDDGLFRYDGQATTRLPTQVDALLVSGRVSAAARLSNGQYAIGTMLDGAILIDEAGRLVGHLHKSTGLQDAAVLSLYEDRQRGLWMGLQAGISRAETGSPLTYWSDGEGIAGSIWDMRRHNGRLYMASIMGLFYLAEGPAASSGGSPIRRVSGVPPQCWALEAFNEHLLAGTSDGVYEIVGTQNRRIAEGVAYSVHRSRQDPNRVFVGMRSGIQSLYYSGGQWRQEGFIAGIDEEIRHIYERPDGQLWLINYFKGFLRVDFSKGYRQQPSVKRYDRSHGLPPPDRVVAFDTDQGFRFATLGGIFLFDEAQQRFFRDTTLVEGLGGKPIELFAVGSDTRGNLWMVADNNAKSGVAMRQSKGKYVWQQTPFLRIAEALVFSVYPDPGQEGVTWIGSNGQLVRYDERTAPTHNINFRTLIRQVTINGDSLIYGGVGAPPEAGKLKLAYTNNTLRFNFAAPSFDDESKNEYQYLLEGYDEDWSNWSAETYKDYTGLPPGTYRFLVRGRNVYQHIGAEAVFEFRVLPPFYLRWWAFILYALIVAAAARLWRQNALRLLEKKHAQQIKQLEYEKLKELDQLKSQFFADISHEFRTPLTLILGPIDTLLSGKPAEEQARQYHLIKRSAQRLLRLINELLDLSKLEAGKMTLDLRPQDLVKLLQGVVYSFESLAQGKNISLELNCRVETAVLLIDSGKMEQVMINLVSNAIKFTPPHGRVSVELSLSQGEAKIEVRDTGPGIAPVHLPHVFDRFYQVADASNPDGVGSGIGLALSKELVELHGGRIKAYSKLGEGASFCVWLACGEVPISALPAPPEASAGERHPWLEPAREVPASTPAAEEIEAENTVLLVEDNADMRSFIREVLAAHYRVIEATDGQEGIDKALEHIPDLIISDVMMPHKNGLELCSALKNDQRTSHIPLILLTAKADVESRLVGLERGADDYLAKPFHQAELLLRARNVLSWRERLRARYALLAPAPAASPATDDKGIQIEDAFVQKIRELVLQHLSDASFEVDQLAQLSGMSRSQLFRKIKALTGQSPSLFIRSLRLQRAKELLETTDMNISEIGYEVGFSTPTYFSDAFLETFGMRPSQVRR